MRIALLHYTKSPVVGGVERVIRDQARAMNQLGHEAAVIDREDWRCRIASEWDAIIVHNVFSMPFDLEWTRELTVAVAESESVRWINWVHDVAALNPAYRGTPWMEPVPHAIHVAVSEVRAAEWREVAGLAPDEVLVIPNGIDPGTVLGLTRRVEELLMGPKLQKAEWIGLLPARLVRRKNIELGIEVIAELKRSGMEAVLWVTGAPDPHQLDGGVYLKELKLLADERGVIEKIQFLGEAGELTDADVVSLYRVADALFFPSASEGFGLPLLEAILHRLPVWCTDLPAHREVLQGVPAHWFSVNITARELAVEIMQSVKNDLNSGVSRQVMREHSWSRLCKERLEPLLTQAI